MLGARCMSENTYRATPRALSAKAQSQERLWIVQPLVPGVAPLGPCGLYTGETCWTFRCHDACPLHRGLALQLLPGHLL